MTAAQELDAVIAVLSSVGALVLGAFVAVKLWRFFRGLVW